MSQSRLAQRPLWLITRHDISSLEILTIGSEDEERVLPIFSFEEEAQLFLRFCEAGRDWKVRVAGNTSLAGTSTPSLLLTSSVATSLLQPRIRSGRRI